MHTVHPGCILFFVLSPPLLRALHATEMACRAAPLQGLTRRCHPQLQGGPIPTSCQSSFPRSPGGYGPYEPGSGDLSAALARLEAQQAEVVGLLRAAQVFWNFHGLKFVLALSFF